MNYHWTKPYCGISYLETKKGFHVSICKHDDCAEGTILSLYNKDCFSNPLFIVKGEYETVKKELLQKSLDLGIAQPYIN